MIYLYTHARTAACTQLVAFPRRPRKYCKMLEDGGIDVLVIIIKVVLSLQERLYSPPAAIDIMQTLIMKILREY